MNNTITFKDMLKILVRREFYIDILVIFFICVPCVLLFLFGIRMFENYMNINQFIHYPYNILFFLLFSPAGFLFIWYSYTYLIIYGDGSPCPQIGGTTKLVMVGPYAYVRHPSVIGKFFGVLGVGFLFGSPVFVFVIIPILTIWSAYYNRFIQEKYTEEKFGQAYVQYRKNTPMFIPNFRKKDF
ncbi:MAG: isoprenylcysteine carboxylmethyltransferase family protein [Endomicrobiaceae bacterium]|nr:isoprenylcysteine carboxylmethyltransferase family protein [Endomicrobiaceae bacterium]